MRRVACLSFLSALFGLNGFASPTAYGLDLDKCTVSFEQFNGELAAASDWSTLYSLFRRYLPDCPDDGFYGEAYSDVVTRLMAHRWSDVSTLQTLMRSDSNFHAFVIAHIDATANSKDLSVALRNAREACPNGAATFCSAIAARAKSALAN